MLSGWMQIAVLMRMVWRPAAEPYKMFEKTIHIIENQTNFWNKKGPRDIKRESNVKCDRTEHGRMDIISKLPRPAKANVWHSSLIELKQHALQKLISSLLIRLHPHTIEMARLLFRQTQLVWEKCPTTKIKRMTLSNLSHGTDVHEERISEARSLWQRQKDFSSLVLRFVHVINIIGIHIVIIFCCCSESRVSRLFRWSHLSM